MSAERSAALTAFALNHFVTSPGNRTSGYCYAELAISSTAVAMTVTGTHCVYPRMDGQAEFTWWPVKYEDDISAVSHLNTIPARRMATSLTCAR